MRSVLAEMALNTEAMAEAIEPAMDMTEKAVQLAAEGMSFRGAACASHDCVS